MNTIRIAVIAAGAACALAGGIAAAQGLGEITVQGTRTMDVKTVAKTPGGAEIRDITMSYAVSIAGLDLAKHEDFLTAEKRVREAATAACKEIGRHYMNVTTSEADCAKAASDKAMVQVNALASGAAKK